MDTVFNFFAKIGDYLFFAFIIACGFLVYLLGKRIYKKLCEKHSSVFAKCISIIICIVIVGISVCSLFCSWYSSTRFSDNLLMIYYDKDITAGDTMHVVFKGKPNTAYDIEFESICESRVEKSNGLGYVSYICRTNQNDYRGEDSFHIYEYDSAANNESEYFYFTIR